VQGSWDDLNRRLVGALLGLDLGDVLTVGSGVRRCAGASSGSHAGRGAAALGVGDGDPHGVTPMS
jgi:hypothetical protein